MWIKRNRICGILYLKFSGIDATNQFIKLLIITLNDMICIVEREIKESG